MRHGSGFGRFKELLGGSEVRIAPSLGLARNYNNGHIGLLTYLSLVNPFRSNVIIC